MLETKVIIKRIMPMIEYVNADLVIVALTYRRKMIKNNAYNRVNVQIVMQIPCQMNNVNCWSLAEDIVQRDTFIT